MPYNPRMSLITDHDDSGYEKELESLQAYYGSEAFTRSILEVYIKDCPAALARLMATIDDNDLEGAKHAIHSLTNIMGVVGPVSSHPIIGTISAALNDEQLKESARHARELESMVHAALAGINAWLAEGPRYQASNGKTTKGSA